jgi:hypothetical protein
MPEACKNNAGSKQAPENIATPTYKTAGFLSPRNTSNQLAALINSNPSINVNASAASKASTIPNTNNQNKTDFLSGPSATATTCGTNTPKNTNANGPHANRMPCPGNPNGNATI